MRLVLILMSIAVVACNTQEMTPTGSGAVPTRTAIGTPVVVDPGPTLPQATAAARPSPTRSPSATVALAAPTVASLPLEPTATATPPPATSPTPTLTPTRLPTSSVKVGWTAYKNDYFGYEFAHPDLVMIRIQGVTGFPSDELPEGMTAEAYLQQLEASYPDNLCVTVRYQVTFVTIVPAPEKEGRYTVPCGVTGVGDYDVVDVSETIDSNGVSHTANGWRLYERGTDTWRGEFYFLEVSDTITIHYGSLTAGTHEVYRFAEETMREIVRSFRQE